MTSTPTSTVAAIFDMDDTLLLGSSGSMLIRYLRRTGELNRWMPRREQPLFVLGALLYRLGLMDPTWLLQRMGKASGGWDAGELWRISNRWFTDMVVHAICPNATQQIAWHRNQAHRPVICSGSSQFAVTLVANHLEIEDFLFTEWIVKDGRLTGDLRRPLTYGEGKLFWMEQWAAEENIDLTQSYFYTDHVSDRYLLEAVGNPVAVNPERRLRRLAAQRRWPIKVWRQPR